jgi:uncharacterized membrane protein YciS (DUF1049 family)
MITTPHAMKTFFSILTLGMIVAAFIAGMFYATHKVASPPVAQQVTLEKIISIKGRGSFATAQDDVVLLPSL